MLVDQDSHKLAWQVCDWSDEGEIHVVPTDAEHQRKDCWCQPDKRELSNAVIYIHFVKQ